MRFGYAIIEKILIGSIFLALAPGFGACTKGQAPTDQTGSAIVAEKVEQADPAKPACGTPEFKDHPGCKLVNTSFYGHFRIGPVKLEGVIKNIYDATGKLLKQDTYPKADSTQPFMVVDDIYNGDGNKQVVTTTTDQNSDLTMDTRLTETWSYLPDPNSNKPSKVIMTLESIPPAGPVLETQRSYNYPSPTLWYFSQYSNWAGNPVQLAHYHEYYTVNPDAYPERISKDLWDPAATEKSLEDHTYEYDVTKGKPVSSEGKVYYCPDQPAGSNPGAIATRCVATFNLATGLVLNDAAVPYGVQNVTWKYDDKGRVSRMDVVMDGDMYEYDPGTKKGKRGPVDGIPDLTWWCDFSYDDTWPEATIAAYPKEFEIFGVSTHDKIDSIVCKDTTDAVSAELHFDKWAYLHEVHADVAGP